jgi:hypothetical protein
MSCASCVSSDNCPCVSTSYKPHRPPLAPPWSPCAAPMPTQTRAHGPALQWSSQHPTSTPWCSSHRQVTDPSLPSSPQLVNFCSSAAGCQPETRKMYHSFSNIVHVPVVPAGLCVHQELPITTCLSEYLQQLSGCSQCSRRHLRAAASHM